VIQDHSWQLASFLQGESDLRELPPDAAMAIATQSRLRSVRRGGAVYRQGEAPAAGSIYVVLEGRVSLRHKLRFAREFATPPLGPGALIGGMGAIADLEVSETATAEADVRLLEISRGSYEYLCLAQPLVAHRLARLVARRHAQVTQHFMRVVAAGHPAAGTLGRSGARGTAEAEPAS
jgi:CRP/FNR family transcriptional regulator